MISKGDRRSRQEAVLLDLDGTLLDTRPGILGALKAAMVDVTGASGADEQVNTSLPVDEMIMTAAPDLSVPSRQQIAIAFRSLYDERYWADARVYPGATACLGMLRDAGLRLFVVTNKRKRAASRLLEHFGMAAFLDGTFAQADDRKAVPKSSLVRRCLRGGQIAPRDAVLIGDSDQDANAAAALGIAFVAVTTGTGPLGHWPDSNLRLEVASLEDAAASVLARHPGRNQ